MTQARHILNAEEMNRAIVRIAHEIVEKNKGTQDLVLIGIHTGGAFLAKRFQDELHKIENKTIPLGALDITMYRDDLSEVGAQPDIKGTDISFDVHGKKVILVDDVLFTGRTIRCALSAIIDFGRPQMIQLAVLVDRGHRQLPIKADYVGKNIPTSIKEVVRVSFKEKGGEDLVTVAEKSR